MNEEELKALGKALRTESNAFHPHAVTIITLLALTGCRLNEIAGLQWSEFDKADRCLRLEDSKTGRSMRAIGLAAVEIIAAQPRQAGSPFVFSASRGEGAYQGTKRQARAIFEAAGIADASSHTLRHTFGSIASDLGYSDATIAGLLGHKGRGVTSRYVHRPDAALVAAAEAVAARISASMGTNSAL